VKLSAETDAQGHAIEECVTFGGGQTWGPVVLADVSLAGETAAKLPVQIMDDAPDRCARPAGCGDNGTLINDVAGFSANGVLGVGVFAQDCGAACVGAASPLAIYFSCAAGAAGVCTPANVALTSQVTNPVAMFAADNNGVIVEFPTLQNANGDLTAQGKLTIGLGTQSDNTVPLTGVTVLGTDAAGDFSATYQGTVRPALIDSGSSSYAFDDPTIAVCDVGAYIGYYCPAVAPLAVSVVAAGRGTNTGTSTVAFAVADPNTFVAGATAFTNLGRRCGARRTLALACRSSTAARSMSASASASQVSTPGRSTRTDADATDVARHGNRAARSCLPAPSQSRRSRDRSPRRPRSDARCCAEHDWRPP